MSLPTLSVVIPVYRSAPILADLAAQIDESLHDYDYEVIFVVDGSPDESWEVVGALTEASPHRRGIELMRNYGQHNALLCGIRAAKNELVVTMDDDLQHPPEEIYRLIERLDEGFDVVYGPPIDPKHSLFRNIASQVTKLVLQTTMGAETARQVSAFRAFRANIRDAFQDVTGPFANIDVLLTWGTTRFSAVPVRHDPRAKGESNYTFWKLVRHAMNMLTGFSTLPLRLASFIGFGLTLFGIGILTFVVGRYLIEGTTVPGFPFLASVIAIFSGAQLFALGIMGEYLARLHFRMMDRPTYVVRQSIEDS